MYQEFMTMWKLEGDVDNSVENVEKSCEYDKNMTR